MKVKAKFGIIILKVQILLKLIDVVPAESWIMAGFGARFYHRCLLPAINGIPCPKHQLDHSNSYVCYFLPVQSDHGKTHDVLSNECCAVRTFRKWLFF